MRAPASQCCGFYTWHYYHTRPYLGVSPTQPPQLSKVESLKNNLLDHTQILKLDLDENTKVKNAQMKTTYNGRRSLMEDNLKI